ncbi:MAG: hypothetical protein ACFFCE_12710 [Promethearchaeota archaeon]
MNFSIPRNDNSEMLFYIWKIIDFPSISQNELLYKISFELFLFTPDEAKIFIEECIQNKILEKDDNESLKLSKTLNKKFQTWQIDRKNSILKKISVTKEITQQQNDTDDNKTTNFNVLINSFTDRATLNRSVSISDTSFELLEYDTNKGIIKSKVKGTKEEQYIIEINTNEKILRHNCHDFKTRRADNKKFCKHLAKLFILLKNKNKNTAEFFLNNIAENIDKWDFSA